MVITPTHYPITGIRVLLYQPVIYTLNGRYHHSDLPTLQNWLHYQNSQYTEMKPGNEERNF